MHKRTEVETQPLYNISSPEEKSAKKTDFIKRCQKDIK